MEKVFFTWKWCHLGYDFIIVHENTVGIILGDTDEI
jgi:hypothetical protein